jgi:hypothetical protein
MRRDVSEEEMMAILTLRLPEDLLEHATEEARLRGVPLEEQPWTVVA